MSEQSQLKNLSQHFYKVYGSEESKWDKEIVKSYEKKVKKIQDTTAARKINN